MSEMLSDLQKIRLVNRNAVKIDGSLKSIAEQFADYAFVKRNNPTKADREYMPLVLIPDCSIFDIPELEGKPLIAFNSALEHIEDRHGGSLSELTLLPDEMSRNLLVFQDPDFYHHFTFVLQEKSPAGNRYIAVMDVETQVNAVSVNRLITCHGKRDLSEKIARTFVAGLKVYVNERTGALIGDSDKLGSESSELDPATARLLSNLYCTRFPSQAFDLGMWNDESLRWLWNNELADVPFDELPNGELVLAEDWHSFGKGTEREAIWAFFDEEYSQGVHALMFPGEHVEPVATQTAFNRHLTQIHHAAAAAPSDSSAQPYRENRETR